MKKIRNFTNHILTFTLLFTITFSHIYGIYDFYHQNINKPYTVSPSDKEDEQ